MTTLSAGGARAIGLLASLITVPLTFRYLGPERYGLWMVLVSIISVMSFADLGIGLGLINAISEAHGKDDHALAKEYVTSALGMLLGIAAVLSLAGAVAYPFLPWMRLFNVKSPAVAAEGARALVVLYAWFVINIPLDIATRVQTGLQKGYFPQIVSALGSLATMVALLVVIGLHGNLVWLVFGSTIGSIVSTMANAWILFHRDPWLTPSFAAFRFDAAKKIFNLGLMFFVLQCAVVMAYSSDNIVITQVMGAAAVAAYAVPQKLFGLITMVVGMAISPLWPAYGEALSRGDVRWVRRAFFGSLWLVLGITIPSCTILALAGPWILRIFFGKALHAPMSLLIVLGVWAVVCSVSNVIAMLLNGTGTMKVQTVTAVIASTLNLGLSIMLTYQFGVIGVCLGSIITQLLITVPVCSFAIRNLFKRMAEVPVIGDRTHLSMGPEVMQ